MAIAKEVEKFARNVGRPAKECKIICPLLLGCLVCHKQLIFHVIGTRAVPFSCHVMSHLLALIFLCFPEFAVNISNWTQHGCCMTRRGKLWPRIPTPRLTG